MAPKINEMKKRLGCQIRRNRREGVRLVSSLCIEIIRLCMVYNENVLHPKMYTIIFKRHTKSSEISMKWQVGFAYAGS